MRINEHHRDQINLTAHTFGVIFLVCAISLIAPSDRLATLCRHLGEIFRSLHFPWFSDYRQAQEFRRNKPHAPFGFVCACHRRPKARFWRGLHYEKPWKESHALHNVPFGLFPERPILPQVILPFHFSRLHWWQQLGSERILWRLRSDASLEEQLTLTSPASCHMPPKHQIELPGVHHLLQFFDQHQGAIICSHQPQKLKLLRGFLQGQGIPSMALSPHIDCPEHTLLQLLSEAYLLRHRTLQQGRILIHLEASPLWRWRAHGIQKEDHPKDMLVIRPLSPLQCWGQDSLHRLHCGKTAMGWIPLAHPPEHLPRCQQAWEAHQQAQRPLNNAI